MFGFLCFWLVGGIVYWRFLCFCFLSCFPSQVFAASCVRSSDEELYKAAPVVFIGKVIQKEEISDRDGWHMEMLPERVLKGKVPNPVSIYIDYGWNNRGRFFKLGESYLIYTGAGGDFSIGDCTPSPSLQYAQNALKVIADIHGSYASLDRAMVQAPDEVEALRHAKVALYAFYNDYAPMVEFYRQWLSSLSSPQPKLRLKLIDALYKLRDAEGVYAEMKGLDNVPAKERNFALFSLAKVDEISADEYSFTLNDERIFGGGMPGINRRDVRFNAVYIERADFTGASLTGHMRKSTFVESRFRYAVFGEDDVMTDLNNTRFYQSDFRGAKLDGILLTKAHFNNVQMDDASMRGVSWNGGEIAGNFANVDLSQAQLRDVDIRGADLSRANLTEIKLPDSKYDCATKWPSGFNARAAGATPTANCDEAFEWRSRSRVRR